MTKLHVFGDSHVIALNQGMEVLSPQLGGKAIDIDFYSRHGLNWKQFNIQRRGTAFHCSAAHFPAEPMEYTVDKPGDVYVFSGPFHSAPACRHPAWQEFCPWQCMETFPDLHVVSNSVIEDFAEQRTRRPLTLLRRMKESGYMVLVAEAPKPLTRSPAIDGIAAAVVTGVDKVYRSYVSRKLSELGIPIIYVPETTYEDGLTKDEFSATGEGKIHHGNGAFGEMMMKRILQFAAGITLN